jgi:integrase
LLIRYLSAAKIGHSGEAEMATGKITVASLNGLEGWLWCTSCTGFGARRQRKGVFYYLRYRHDGRQVMHSIGRHGAPWTPDTARNEARRLLGIVVTGVDPCAQALAGESFVTAINRYLERKKGALKPRSFEDTERYLRKSAAPLHSLSLEEIDRKKVAALLGQIETNSGPVSRNRARSALSSFFSWCVAEGLLELNPVAGTAKAIQNGSRERVLSADELRQLWHTLPQINAGFADIIRLLLLTGARRNEIGLLTWSEIDFKRGMIVLGPERTKNRKTFELPLSTQALAILLRQRRRNSTEFVFSDKGYQDWDRAKQRLDRRLQIAEWHLHDCRRTCATQLAELGILPHVIETTLNHVSGHKAGVAGIYNRSKMTDAVREGLQKWADHVDALTR